MLVLKAQATSYSGRIAIAKKELKQLAAEQRKLDVLKNKIGISDIKQNRIQDSIRKQKLILGYRLITSPIDGVVAEVSSVIPDYIVDNCDPAAPRENLRVFSTHVGMGVNPWVLLAIADRLAQDKADWQPFNPNDYFADALSWMVPLLYPAQPDRR